MVSQGRPEALSRAVKAAERAARIEHQLAMAQQITHIGSWEWDLGTGVVTWSDELYRIYGLEPQSCEITFETFLERLHPDDRGRIQLEVRRALETGSRFAYEERILRPDGSIRQLDTVGDVARDESGRVLGLIGTCRDVTDERKRDESIRLYANIVQNVQIPLTVWKVADVAQPREATLVAFNPAAEHAARRGLAEWVGQPVCAVFPSLADTELSGVLQRVARDDAIHELSEFRFEAAPGRVQTFWVKGFPLPGACVGLAMEDVTLQVRARHLREAEQQVLEMIAAGEELEHVLGTLVLMIEEQAPPTIASILLMDPDGQRVRHGAAPHLPEVYNRAIDGVRIGPRAGSCGTAAYLRRAVFAEDVATDPNWEEYRDLALPHGLRACWSTPIFSSDGRVLGTFALYYREPRSPSPADLELIARATHVAGIAIQRKQLDDQLRALSAHIEAVREEERTAVAREIHDDLGQALTALKMDVAWIGRRLELADEQTRAVLRDKLASMSELTDQVIDSVRRIASELRPGVLDDLGLLAALEWQAQQFQERTDTTCVVETNVGDLQLDRSLATAIFRICQEALTNVARHARAKRVEVVFEEREGSLRLEVRDDGQGISQQALSNTGSLGLLGMRERARRLGGDVWIGPAAEAGTAVIVEVPFAPTEEAP